MDRSGRVMERALSESVDIYTDYTGVADSDDAGWAFVNLIISHIWIEKLQTCINYLFKYSHYSIFTIDTMCVIVCLY